MVTFDWNKYHKTYNIRNIIQRSKLFVHVTMGPKIKVLCKFANTYDVLGCIKMRSYDNAAN